MTVSVRQHRMLDAMGITVWQRRERQIVHDEGSCQSQVPDESPSAAMTAPGPEGQSDAQPPAQTGLRWVQQCDEAVATVVVEWNEPESLKLTESHAAGQLLMRILQALEQPGDRYRIACCASLADLTDLDAGPTPVFCFADSSTLPDANWVALPSLRRMLDEGRNAKAEAWRNLKPWIPRLTRN